MIARFWRLASVQLSSPLPAHLCVVCPCLMVRWRPCVRAAFCDARTFVLDFRTDFPSYRRLNQKKGCDFSVLFFSRIARKVTFFFDVGSRCVLAPVRVAPVRSVEPLLCVALLHVSASGSPTLRVRSILKQHGCASEQHIHIFSTGFELGLSSCRTVGSNV